MILHPLPISIPMFIILLQNEQLKDLSNLRKQVNILQIEKNESEKMIEKQKINFEKRENELLAIIQVNALTS